MTDKSLLLLREGWQRWLLSCLIGEYLTEDCHLRIITFSVLNFYRIDLILAIYKVEILVKSNYNKKYGRVIDIIKVIKNNCGVQQLSLNTKTI